MDVVTILCACIVGGCLLLYHLSSKRHDDREIAHLTPEMVAKLNTEFRVRPDDVFVTSFPKSGTTWVQQIVRLVLLHGRSRNDTQDVLDKEAPWIEAVESPISGSHVTLRDIEALESPRMLKTHVPYDLIPGGPPHTTPAKYIYVARNPKDTAVSVHHFLANIWRKGGGPRLIWWLSYKIFISGKAGFGHWHDHVTEWWNHRDESNVLFLKYEDIHKDLSGAVRKVVDFLECKHLDANVIDSITRQCTFESMQQDTKVNFSWVTKEKSQKFAKYYMSKMRIFVYMLRILEFFQPSPSDSPEVDKGAVMMRKGIVGNWRDHFSQKQSDQIDRLCASKLEKHGLRFEYG